MRRSSKTGSRKGGERGQKGKRLTLGQQDTQTEMLKSEVVWVQGEVGKRFPQRVGLHLTPLHIPAGGGELDYSGEKTNAKGEQRDHRIS